MRLRIMLGIVFLSLPVVPTNAGELKFVTVYPAPYAYYSRAVTSGLSLVNADGTSVMTITPTAVSATVKPIRVTADKTVLGGTNISYTSDALAVTASGAVTLTGSGAASASASSSGIIAADNTITVSSPLSFKDAAGSAGALTINGEVSMTGGTLVRQCPGGKLIPDGATCPPAACGGGSVTYTSKSCSTTKDITSWLNAKATSGAEFPGSDFCAFGCQNVGCCSICTANAYYTTVSGTKYIYLHFAGASFTVSFDAANPRCDTGTGYYDCNGQCTLTAPATYTASSVCLYKTNSTYFSATTTAGGGSYLDCSNACTATTAPTCTGVAVGRLMPGS